MIKSPNRRNLSELCLQHDVTTAADNVRMLSEKKNIILTVLAF